VAKNRHLGLSRPSSLIPVLGCIDGNLLFAVIGDWLLLSGVVGFFAMGLDKARAGSGEWRISEKTLFIIALSGGSLGVALGGLAFHHKTSKESFLIVLYPIVSAWIFAISKIGFLDCLFSSIPHV
jgi:uncharacterized membrane protein YsdA (DUF1294 family)